MRFAAYAGASTVLAAGIVLRAFHERPNFYSATVYLAQSSACRMILLNLLLLTTYGAMRALQKVLYGPLRAIEREQLWDKAWYAVTETALAMTTFRDEVGAWFFIMFISLLAGKVWGWLSEARVEALEQQPPTNPRLFHMRLIVSLAISEIFDFLMLRYCVLTLIDDPRPGMMVMFAFEFAILAITSTSTTLKYLLALQEKLVVSRQMKAKIEERRQEIREAREEAQRQTESAPDGNGTAAANSPAEDEEIDENEIDVPGWQEKGRWVLFLDLLTDLLKLLVYMCFFTILLMFHGIPIHIIRDVFLTTRSFLQRIADFLKYRNATKDMNARYPDATAEELSRDGTCIICREEMRPWHQPAAPGGDNAANRRASRVILDERQRPKKLPCGHILHFGCLRSWLERQQVCPTCRSSVLGPSTNRGGANGAGGGRGAQQPGQQPGGAQQPDQNRPGARPNPRRARTFNLGPYRIAFAAGDEQQVRDALQALRQENQGGNQQGVAPQAGQAANAGTLLPGSAIPLVPHGAGYASGSLQDQIARLEEQFQREFNNLAVAEQQLTVVRGLQQELERLSGNVIDPASGSGVVPQPINASQTLSARMTPLIQPLRSQGQDTAMQSEQHVLTGNSQQAALGSGDPNLPSGFALPPGWTLLPIRRSAIQETLIDTQGSSSIIIDPVVAQLPFNGGADRLMPQQQPGLETLTQLGIASTPASSTTAPPTAHDTFVLGTGSLREPDPGSSIPHQQSSHAEASAHGIFTPEVSDASAPETSAPETSAPKTSAPETSAPGSSASAQAVGENGDIADNTNLPNWANASWTPAAAQSSSEPLSNTTIDTANDRESAQTNGPPAEDKGKGKEKAVTVEDVKDEDDV